MPDELSRRITVHSFADTTVGIAHGTSIAARIRPRPGNFELITMAMKMPRISSIVTETTVNISVLPIDPMKFVSRALKISFVPPSVSHVEISR